MSCTYLASMMCGMREPASVTGCWVTQGVESLMVVYAVAGGLLVLAGPPTWRFPALGLQNSQGSVYAIWAYAAWVCLALLAIRGLVHLVRGAHGAVTATEDSYSFEHRCADRRGTNLSMKPIGGGRYDNES